MPILAPVLTLVRLLARRPGIGVPVRHTAVGVARLARRGLRRSRSRRGWWRGVRRGPCRRPALSGALSAVGRPARLRTAAGDLWHAQFEQPFPAAARIPARPVAYRCPTADPSTVPVRPSVPPCAGKGQPSETDSSDFRDSVKQATCPGPSRRPNSPTLRELGRRAGPPPWPEWSTVASPGAGLPHGRPGPTEREPNVALDPAEPWHRTGTYRGE